MRRLRLCSHRRDVDVLPCAHLGEHGSTATPHTAHRCGHDGHGRKCRHAPDSFRAERERHVLPYRSQVDDVAARSRKYATSSASCGQARRKKLPRTPASRSGCTDVQREQWPERCPADRRASTQSSAPALANGGRAQPAVTEPALRRTGTMAMPTAANGCRGGQEAAESHVRRLSPGPQIQIWEHEIDAPSSDQAASSTCQWPRTTDAAAS